MKKIVILGGGSAGWMTALFVKKIWPINDVTLIEDPTTPPIIAIVFPDTLGPLDP